MFWLLLLIWAALAMPASMMADKRGRSAVGFFFLSILFSPIVAIPVVLMLGENKDELLRRDVQDGVMKKCPACAELVLAEANICRYCRTDLSQPAS